MSANQSYVLGEKMGRLAAAVTVALLLGACTHMNRYEGEDAALVELPCGLPLVHDANGNSYQARVSVLTVDGTFTGSGHGCSSGYTYRIMPGIKHLVLISNFPSKSKPISYYGKVSVQVELKPQARYTLTTSFNGKEVEAAVIDSSSGEVLAKGKTSKLGIDGATNGALMALPLIIK